MAGLGFAIYRGIKLFNPVMIPQWMGPFCCFSGLRRRNGVCAKGLISGYSFSMLFIHYYS